MGWTLRDLEDLWPAEYAALAEALAEE